MWTRAHVAWPGPKRQRAGAFQDAGAPPPDRGLSQTASHRQTDPHQNHSIRHSFIRLLRVGTTRAPEHRHADLKIRRVIPRSKFDLPRSSTPNCHWPPGWDFAGERARPGCRFGVAPCDAFPSAVRRGIFVEPQPKQNPQPHRGGIFRCCRSYGAFELMRCVSTNRPVLRTSPPSRPLRDKKIKRQLPSSSIPNWLGPFGWLGLCWGARPSQLPFPASRQKTFPNPNGIESFSPALTRSGYAGSTAHKNHNPNGVASASGTVDSTPSGVFSFSFRHPA
jgi:hypothetical protein